VLGQALPSDAGPDSFNLLPILTGEARGPVRDHLIYHTNQTALRRGSWVYMPHDDGAKKAAKGAPPELYDLSRDPEQKTNVVAQNPRIVEEMTAMLKKVREAGRSRP
jgi:hypothetical protein